MNESEINPKLNKKLRKKTSILTDMEVKYLKKEAHRLLGPAFAELSFLSETMIEDTFRWMALGARCQEERDKRGLSIKDVSSELRVPQYRLRAIESGSLREIKPDIAHSYFLFLGIKSWVIRWARANAELAQRTGLASFITLGNGDG